MARGWNSGVTNILWKIKTHLVGNRDAATLEPPFNSTVFSGISFSILLWEATQQLLHDLDMIVNVRRVDSVRWRRQPPLEQQPPTSLAARMMVVSCERSPHSARKVRVKAWMKMGDTTLCHFFCGTAVPLPASTSGAPLTCLDRWSCKDEGPSVQLTKCYMVQGLRNEPTHANIRDCKNFSPLCLFSADNHSMKSASSLE